MDIPEILTKSVFRDKNFTGRDRRRLRQNSHIYNRRRPEKIREWRSLAGDGTFKTAPTLFTQLYTIHGSIGGRDGEILPLVYALMTRKTSECYDQFVQHINKIASDLNIALNPKFVLTDFEIASMRTFRRKFPGATSKRCFFHLGKSIYQKIQDCGLAARYGTDLAFALQIRKLGALAFLPCNEVKMPFLPLNRRSRKWPNRWSSGLKTRMCCEGNGGTASFRAQNR